MAKFCKIFGIFCDCCNGITEEGLIDCNWKHLNEAGIFTKDCPGDIALVEMREEYGKVLTAGGLKGEG